MTPLGSPSIALKKSHLFGCLCFFALNQTSQRIAGCVKRQLVRREYASGHVLHTSDEGSFTAAFNILPVVWSIITKTNSYPLIRYIFILGGENTTVTFQQGYIVIWFYSKLHCLNGPLDESIRVTRMENKFLRATIPPQSDDH